MHIVFNLILLPRMLTKGNWDRCFIRRSRSSGR
jgi:hypothetical protein